MTIVEIPFSKIKNDYNIVVLVSNNPFEPNKKIRWVTSEPLPMIAWLKEHHINCLIEYSNHSEAITYSFDDEKDALMFKLVWS